MRGIMNNCCESCQSALKKVGIVSVHCSQCLLLCSVWELELRAYCFYLQSTSSHTSHLSTLTAADRPLLPTKHWLNKLSCCQHGSRGLFRHWRSRRISRPQRMVYLIWWSMENSYTRYRMSSVCNDTYRKWISDIGLYPSTKTSKLDSLLLD